ncbi:MAG: hypothetical protein K0U74_01160 [Alphaproteobacteria bacterium]|nr:hypothetical protein [Alphaproteobacteria bacterium]
MIAAALRILFGFALACFAAALTQVLFVITPADLYGLEGQARWERLGFSVAIAASAAAQIAVFAAPFALAAVLFGVLMGLRGWAFYVFAGLVVALLGLGVIYAGEQGSEFTIANGYAIAAYAFSGIIAGYVYWVMAGYRAGAGFSAADQGHALVDGEGEDAGSREHLTAKDYGGAEKPAEKKGGSYLSERYSGDGGKSGPGGAKPVTANTGTAGASAVGGAAAATKANPGKLETAGAGPGQGQAKPGQEIPQKADSQGTKSANQGSNPASSSKGEAKDAAKKPSVARVPDAGGRRTH